MQTDPQLACEDVMRRLRTRLGRLQQLVDSELPAAVKPETPRTIQPPAAARPATFRVRRAASR